MKNEKLSRIGHPKENPEQVRKLIEHIVHEDSAKEVGDLEELILEGQLSDEALNACLQALYEIFIIDNLGEGDLGDPNELHTDGVSNLNFARALKEMGIEFETSNPKKESSSALLEFVLEQLEQLHENLKTKEARAVRTSLKLVESEKALPPEKINIAIGDQELTIHYDYGIHETRSGERIRYLDSNTVALDSYTGKEVAMTDEIREAVVREIQEEYGDDEIIVKNEEEARKHR